MKNVSIACSLTASELRIRREEILRVFKAHVQETRELETGLAFRFEPNENVIDELSRFIQFERRCCSFFRFSLIVEANLGPVWLEVTGNQAKDFLKSELGL